MDQAVRHLRHEPRLRAFVGSGVMARCIYVLYRRKIFFKL